MSESDISLPVTAGPATAERSDYVDWKQWSPGDFAKCSFLEAAFFDAEVVPLLAPGAAKWRVLELGFGNGPFLGWCQGRRIDYFGVELDPAMRERARARGVAVADSLFDRELEAMAGSFDLVAAFDVIEHIEQDELPAVFSRIEALLKRGGHFVARFPNGDSPFGRVNQHGDMTHVATLGRGKIHHLASLSKLTVVSIADPKRPWKNVGLGNATRRLMGGIAKTILEASIRTLYFGGEPICFDRNIVAVLKK
jgi:SAM-dependent methyltransferase